VFNLLSNALKFSSQGEILVSLTASDSEITCCVHDEGIGIPPEELPDLFQHFYRGDMAERKRIQGTGLGLALSREIIEAQSGWKVQG
jgi:signal transduction histidine kinase